MRDFNEERERLIRALDIAVDENNFERQEALTHDLLDLDMDEAAEHYRTSAHFQYEWEEERCPL